MIKPTVIIIGGGAAGFFSACQLAESNFRGRIIILEKDKEVLKKVRISGGGRCNVTHACYDPVDLTKYYPRGRKELHSPFLHFQPGDTRTWFSKYGIDLKTESDGRIFPVTDSSETIIQCFLDICTKAGVEIMLKCKVTEISRRLGKWYLRSNEKELNADFLIVTTGSDHLMWNTLTALGHSVVPPVPSLFTFKIKDRDLVALAGISLPKTRITIRGLKEATEGSILITHWGLSGPAILKMSAYAAIHLHDLQYEFDLKVNWVCETTEKIAEDLKRVKENQGKKQIGNITFHQIPNRLWIYFLQAAKIAMNQQCAHITNKQYTDLAIIITGMTFLVQGKSTHKEEFVTAGGVSLKEINFKNFQSRLHEHLYFAGEILNIDGYTGGFNFQAAWTGAHLLAKDILLKIR
jgi:predicted Rossmann fold flavoprotein